MGAETVAVVNKEENSRGVRDYIAATCADAVRKMRG
jgi:hypothetical protein